MDPHHSQGKPGWQCRFLASADCYKPPLGREPAFCLSKSMNLNNKHQQHSGISLETQFPSHGGDPERSLYSSAGKRGGEVQFLLVPITAPCPFLFFTVAMNSALGVSVVGQQVKPPPATTTMWMQCWAEFQLFHFQSSFQLM